MLCGLCHAHQELFHPLWKLCFCLKVNLLFTQKSFQLGTENFTMLKLYLNFLIFCMVISPSGLDFPIHASGPLADWIIQATGSLINILQLFLFPDLNIFFKWTHKSNKSLRLKLSFNFQRSVIHSRIKRSHCTWLNVFFFTNRLSSIYKTEIHFKFVSKCKNSA